MDNRGYIFSTDAVLALVIFFVIVGSILTYYTLPSYLGADHQHLEAEADAVLASLQADGTLTTAILKINSGNQTQYDEGVALLKDKLNLLLPDDVAYDLQIPNVKGDDLKDSKGILNIHDRASRYTVLSAPNEGWIGRAWYKIEDVNFKEERVNTTQTLWMFHNFINQFAWWREDSTKLVGHPYWGTNDDNEPVPIEFSIPSNVSLRNMYVILGCYGKKGTLDLRRTTKRRSGNQKFKENAWNSKNLANSYSPWYPLNGDWNDFNNSIWAYNEFYLLPNALPDPSNAPRPESESTIYTELLDEDEYPELAAFPSFAFNLTINNNHSYFGNISGYPGSPFKFLLKRDNDNSNTPIFNAKASIPTDWFNVGKKNNFYMKFTALKSDYVMPWFSILGDYETSILVPEGIDTDRFPEKNESEQYYCAGLATQGMYATFDLINGTVRREPESRVISFSEYYGKDSNYADGKPFVITSGTVNKDIKLGEKGSAIAREYPVDLTENNTKIKGRNIRVVDAYTVVNTYGAGDNMLVEVYDGEEWHNVFYSLNNSQNIKHKGYGNTPGIIYIPNDYLTPNVVNKVRVTVWDEVPGNDGYDFVGIADTYTVVSFTSLPIKWINYPFVSDQSAVGKNSPTQSMSQIQDFTVNTNPNCEKVMFFFGVGLDTTNVKLEVKDKNNPLSDWKTLYDSSVIPFALDIGAIDAGIDKNTSFGGDHVFAENASDGTYVGKQGEYSIRLTVSTKESWRSGDEYSGGTWGEGKNANDSAACEIFSGSRVSVIYPKFLKNLWVTKYSDTADGAKKNATAELIKVLNNTNDYVNSRVQSEALYTGDMPNSVPIRLNLWRS